MVRSLCNLHGIIKALHKLLPTGRSVQGYLPVLSINRSQFFQQRSALSCLLSDYEVRFLCMRVNKNDNGREKYMAKIASFGFDQLTKELEAVANNTDNIAEKALDAQKVTKDREHKTNRLLDYEKKALQDGMYVSDIKKYSSGNTIKAISFSGYADHPTKTYPTGAPKLCWPEP